MRVIPCRRAFAMLMILAASVPISLWLWGLWKYQTIITDLVMIRRSMYANHACVAREIERGIDHIRSTGERQFDIHSAQGEFSEVHIYGYCLRDDMWYLEARLNDFGRELLSHACVVIRKGEYVVVDYYTFSAPVRRGISLS